MAICNIESRIQKLESYDREGTKAECDSLRQQIAAIKKAIEEEKSKPKG